MKVCVQHFSSYIYMISLRLNRNSTSTREKSYERYYSCGWLYDNRVVEYAKKLFFVTGVNGQLGHDVMNELHKRGHQGVGSDLAETYAGVADGSAVSTMPYVGLDITDKEAVSKVIADCDNGRIWL